MRIVNALRLALIASAIAILPTQADPWTKRTLVTIDGPVLLPNTLLQPGTYTFKLIDSPSNRHIVGVWDKDGMKHITTVLAIPNYRMQPTGNSQFTFWETAADQPKALRAWFYPGDNFGQEFAYPKDMLARFAANRTDVPTLTANDQTVIERAPVSEATAQQAAVEQEEQPMPFEPAPERTVAQVDPTPEPEPQQAIAAEPAPEPSPAPPPDPEPQAALPQTASSVMGVALFGLIAGFAGLLTFRNTRTA